MESNLSSGPGSISFFLQQAKAGDSLAFQNIFQRYYERLVDRARRKRESSPVQDADDVASEAFASFAKALREGRYPDLADRDSFWRLLMTIADRKWLNMQRDEKRKKRGGDLVVRTEADVPAATDDSRGFRISDFASNEPSPAFLALLDDEVSTFLQKLNSLKNYGPKVRRVAVLKMQGLSDPEVARQAEVPLRSVQRYVNLSHQLWEEENSV